MKTILLIAFLAANQVSYAQVKQKSSAVGQVKYTALKIGEKVPDINLGEIVNYGNSLPKNKKSIKVSDFKGKILILDFWTSTCSACIEAFPKLEKLQEQFNEQIAIIPVGFKRENKYGKEIRTWGDVVPLIKQWKGTLREMKLPSTSVFESEIESSKSHPFRQIFPFQGFPTIIWIDQDGVFRGTMRSEDLTQENIRDVVKGKLILKSKKLLSPIDLKDYLLKQPKNGSFCFQGSAWSNNIDSVKPQYLRIDSSNNQYYHFYSVNWPLNSIYKTAYENLPEIGQLKGILVDSTVKALREYPLQLNKGNYYQRDSIITNNTFCYEAIFPRTGLSTIDAWRRVIKDLDKFSGNQSRIENKEVYCLKLISKNKAEAFQRKLTYDEIYSVINNKKSVFSSETVDNFLYQLNFNLSEFLDLPVIINETGHIGEIEILFNEEDFKDMNALLLTLRKYGLDLVPGKAKLDVLIQTKTK